jgi:hypothetical protein
MEDIIQPLLRIDTIVSFTSMMIHSCNKLILKVLLHLMPTHYSIKEGNEINIIIKVINIVFELFHFKLSVFNIFS